LGIPNVTFRDTAVWVCEVHIRQALGYEFVKKREYGESLISYGYYVKRETTPVIWKFVFYNPHSRNWILIGLIIQEDMQFLPLLD
jgi:hypothetical protein